MHSRNLKFPAPLFARIVQVPQPILIKWLNGNSLGEALDLDGERERAGGTSHRRYSFDDLVRVLTVRYLQDEFGIATTHAIKICNSAFNEIAAAAEATWQAVEKNNDTYYWEPVGPWIAIEREADRYTASLLKDHKALASHFKPNSGDPMAGPWRSIVLEAHFLVLRANILLLHDAVGRDVEDLRSSQDGSAPVRTAKGAR